MTQKIMIKAVSFLLAVFIMAGSLSGCQARKMEPPAEPAPKEDISPEKPEQNPQEDLVPEEAPPEKLEQQEENPAPEENISPEKPAEETSLQAKVPVDAALNKEKIGWGPGGPTDDSGRPDGATVYQEKYGKYGADFIREENKNIYLTFDEGYENGYTPKILDILKEKKVPAVFFVTMPYVKSQPELVKRMIAEGHIVGNHSVHHPSFPDTEPEKCKEEVMELHRYMKDQFGCEMDLFRFPMGEFSTADLKLLQELGYKSVFWSFAYRDWEVDAQPDPEQALQKIESKCHPGAIYLLHAVSKTNTEVLPQVIDDLRAKGYTFASYHE